VKLRTAIALLQLGDEFDQLMELESKSNCELHLIQAKIAGDEERGEGEGEGEKDAECLREDAMS